MRVIDSPNDPSAAWLQVDYKEGLGWFTAAILDHTHAAEVGEWMFEV